MKPRIRKVGGEWVCSGGGCGALGWSPQLAYERWRIEYRQWLVLPQRTYGFTL